MAKRSNFNLNDLSTWNLPVALAFALIIAFILIFLIKSFFVDDVTEQIEATEREIAQQRSTYSSNKQTVAILPHIQREIDALKVARDQAKKYLPTEVSMPSLVDSVYVSARNNGFVFNQYRPEKGIDTEFYTIRPISLSADVGYISMSAFIEEVTTLKRIMNVHSVSFKSQSETTSSEARNSNTPLKMTAELRTFVFKENAGSENPQGGQQ